MLESCSRFLSEAVFGPERTVNLSAVLSVRDDLRCPPSARCHVEILVAPVELCCNDRENQLHPEDLSQSTGLGLRLTTLLSGLLLRSSLDVAELFEEMNLIKLLIASMLLAFAAAEEESDTGLFIAVVKRGRTIGKVKKEIQRRSDSPHHPWVGTVEKTHPHIGVLIISGPEDTCEVLEEMEGIKQCEEDSTISVAE